MASRFEDVTRKAYDILSGVDQVVGSVAGRAMGVWKGFPRVNTYESPDEFVMRVEIPGVKRRDLELRMEGRDLSISGTEQTEEPRGEVRRRERAEGTFERHVLLPEKADLTKDPEATLRNGVLTIRVPKKSEAATREVEVGEPEEEETQESVSVEEESTDEAQKGQTPSGA